jgi:hypothetical protein
MLFELDEENRFRGIRMSFLVLKQRCKLKLYKEKNNQNT